MDKPIISVVIPCYNVVRFLTDGYMIYDVIEENCPNVEIILINDASTDNTLAQIESIAKDNPNIRIINLENNSGEAVARDAGIDAAIGEYLLVFDQDDTIESGLLWKLLETIDEYREPDLIAFSACVDSKNKTTRLDSKIPRNSLLDRCYIRDYILASNISVRKDDIYKLYPHWRVMYKKEMIDSGDVRYDPNKRKDEDQCFLNEALWCANSFVFIDSPAYHWLRRDDSSTGMYSQMFSNLLDNIHRYQRRFGNYYDLKSQIRLAFNVNKVLPDCYDFILCHETEKDVDKKTEILKILTNEEVLSWYEEAQNLVGQPAKIQKALLQKNTKQAYAIINIGYFGKRLRRLVKKVIKLIIRR